MKAATAFTGACCWASDEAVGAHPELDLSGGQELGHVHAGAALDDPHVESALLVFAGGQRLVEAAVLGLRAPVGGETDLRAPALGLGLGRLLGRRAGAGHGGERCGEKA
jgi:hypothetical protein